MRDACLRLPDGETLPVRILESSGSTLIECEEPMPFLEHITRGTWRTTLTPDTYLRGCLWPREGALFSLCDQFGMVADEVVRLTCEEARELILDRLA